MNDQSKSMVLQPGYELHWYRIESVLGKGAFGITYLAHDINLDRQVAIKEYLPGQFAVRRDDLTVYPITDGHKEDFEWGLKRFVSEAKILTKFEHPNLVRVFNVFEMNKTAYMVMNYEVGKSLQQILKSRKTLSETELMKIIIPLLGGMEVMHEKGFVHRDIKPGNIFIRSDGSPVLLDFGSARQTRGERGQEMSEEAQTVTTLVSPGYAPIEQYGSSGNRQGPWTDIYGLGATLYKAITGNMPIAAVDRSETIVHDNKDSYLPLRNLQKGGYTAQFLAAVDHAMAFKADDRPQNIFEWRTRFGISEDDIPTMAASDKQIESAIASSAKSGHAQNIVKVKNEASPEAITEKIDTESETQTVKVGSVKESDISKPVYLQLKWMTSAVVIIILISLAIFNISDKKEAKIKPVTQSLPEPEYSIEEELVVEEVLEPEVATTLTDDEQARIEELLLLAEEDISELRLTNPSDNNALNKYLSVLMIDENNVEANEGIRFISDKYISLAYSAMQSNNLQKAESHIDKAKSIFPESDKIIPAHNALQAKYEEQDASESQQKVVESPSNAEEKKSESLWESIKKWDEENKDIKREESAIDKTIKEHFK